MKCVFYIFGPVIQGSGDSIDSEIIASCSQNFLPQIVSTPTAKKNPTKPTGNWIFGYWSVRLRIMVKDIVNDRDIKNDRH